MKAVMKKGHDSKWEPADQASLDILSKFKPGDERAFSVSNPRSLRQNNLWHEYLNMIFDNQEKYKTKEELLYTLCVAIGHHTQKIRLSKDGEYVVILERKSTNFEKCKQSDFQEFFDKAKEWIAVNMGIDFDEWQKSEGEGQCQTPGCQNQYTGGPHHLIPGNSYRRKCEELGLVLKLCYKCHLYGHSPEGIHAKKAYIENCKILGIDPEETWRMVKG